MGKLDIRTSSGLAPAPTPPPAPAPAPPPPPAPPMYVKRIFTFLYISYIYSFLGIRRGYAPGLLLGGACGSILEGHREMKGK